MAEQLINQTDAQGRKQGYWEETGRWGDIEKGHYVDGLREGLWKTCFEDGTLRWESHYLNDMRHGLEKRYQFDGVTLSSEGHYLNGKPHGIFKEYYEDGVTLSTEGHYLEGNLEGVWKDYSHDGALMQESHYLNDALMSHKSYYEDGITLVEETVYFVKGDPLTFEYNKDGTISRAYYINEEDEEHMHISQGKIEVYNKIISSVGRETWRAIPRELFDYLHSIEIL